MSLFPKLMGVAAMIFESGDSHDEDEDEGEGEMDEMVEEDAVGRSGEAVEEEAKRRRHLRRKTPRPMECRRDSTSRIMSMKTSRMMMMMTTKKTV